MWKLIFLNIIYVRFQVKKKYVYGFLKFVVSDKDIKEIKERNRERKRKQRDKEGKRKRIQSKMEKR